MPDQPPTPYDEPDPDVEADPLGVVLLSLNTIKNWIDDLTDRQAPPEAIRMALKDAFAGACKLAEDEALREDY